MIETLMAVAAMTVARRRRRLGCCLWLAWAVAYAARWPHSTFAAGTAGIVAGASIVTLLHDLKGNLR